MQKVHLKKGQDAYKLTKEILDEINFKVTNKKVLIKPNLTIPATSKEGITPDTGIIKALLEKLENCEIIIGDAASDTIKAFENNNYYQFKDKCKLIDLNQDTIIEKQIPKPFTFKKIPLAKTVLDVDFIISVSKLKIHSLAGITLNLKNMFGCVPTRSNRVKIHPLISKAVVDYSQIIYPDFNIIDGIIGNEMDEVKSYPIKHGIIIAGYDALAVDVVGCKCMNIMPEEIEHLVLMQKLRNFNINEIETIGEKIEDVNKTYNRKRPLSTSIRYTT